METKKYLHHLCGNAGRTRPSKDAAPAAVGRMYEELDAIGAEKVALAGRLAEKLERAMARLQDTLQEIVKLEGDEGGSLPPTQEFLENMENTVRQITGLRAAAAQAIDTPPAPPVTSSTSAPQPRKSMYLGRCCYTMTLMALSRRAGDRGVFWQRQGLKLGTCSVWPS